MTILTLCSSVSTVLLCCHRPIPSSAWSWSNIGVEKRSKHKTWSRPTRSLSLHTRLGLDISVAAHLSRWVMVSERFRAAVSNSFCLRFFTSSNAFIQSWLKEKEECTWYIDDTYVIIRGSTNASSKSVQIVHCILRTIYYDSICNLQNVSNVSRKF